MKAWNLPTALSYQAAYFYIIAIWLWNLSRTLSNAKRYLNFCKGKGNWFKLSAFGRKVGVEDYIEWDLCRASTSFLWHFKSFYLAFFLPLSWNFWYLRVLGLDFLEDKSQSWIWLKHSSLGLEFWNQGFAVLQSLKFTILYPLWWILMVQEIGILWY